MTPIPPGLAENLSGQDPRWETTQELVRLDVMTAIQIASQPATPAAVLELLSDTAPVILDEGHFGYDPYDTARMAKWARRAQVWDRRRVWGRTLQARMARQGRELFTHRERRVDNLRMARGERAAMFVLDTVIAALGIGIVVLAVMTLVSLRG